MCRLLCTEMQSYPRRTICRQIYFSRQYKSVKVIFTLPVLFISTQAIVHVCSLYSNLAQANYFSMGNGTEFCINYRGLGLYVNFIN